MCNSKRTTTLQKIFLIYSQEFVHVLFPGLIYQRPSKMIKDTVHLDNHMRVSVRIIMHVWHTTLTMIVIHVLVYSSDMP